MAQPLAVQVARPSEWEAALALVFGHLPEEDRDRRIANGLTLIRQGELDPGGITVVRGKSGLLGAMVSLILPGATGLVWPPRAVAGDRQAPVEDRLVRHALAWLRQQGTRMAQAIVTPDEAPQAAPLLRHGFAHITSLWYLRHDLAREDLEDAPAPSRPPAAPDVAFQEYASTDPELFQETLMHTFQGTLDCPELNGIRGGDDVMAAHRGQENADPKLWWLLLEGGVAAGVLFLARIPEWDALDVTYLGVVPAKRRRGLGRVLARKALAEARQTGVSQLTLAVDSRNLPAWNIYRALGFQPQGLREVFLATWRPGPPAAP